MNNSQPFGKKFQKTVGGGFFFDLHCSYMVGACLFCTSQEIGWR